MFDLLDFQVTKASGRSPNALGEVYRGSAPYWPSSPLGETLSLRSLQ
jgi:hypothetical protein